MKNLGKNTLCMLAVAALTMVATLAALGPRGADAADTKDAKTAETLAKVTPTISTPTLAEDNCDISLKADKETYTVGDKPVLTVSVTNNGKESIEKDVTVSMLSRSLISRGRMPSIARVVWTKTETVTVEAGKTAEVKFETDKAIEGSAAMSFSMSGQKEELSTDARLRRALNRVVEENKDAEEPKPDVEEQPKAETKVEK
ncbi:MAG: hypothetical protein KDB82_08210 [Planctomycetes bacterium]|nr:hypothetical protein [Planctomycetota bacterium]